MPPTFFPIAGWNVCISIAPNLLLNFKLAIQPRHNKALISYPRLYMLLELQIFLHLKCFLSSLNRMAS